MMGLISQGLYTVEHRAVVQLIGLYLDETNGPELQG